MRYGCYNCSYLSLLCQFEHLCGLCFQKMNFQPSTLLVIVLAWQRTDAYSSSLCKRACNFMETLDDEKTCERCALYPPTDYHMCLFACHNIEKHHYIGTICDKCFNRRPTMMRYICDGACKLDSASNKSLCDFCKEQLSS